MRHPLRLAALGLMAGVLALFTCGCGFAFSPDDLYSLPALPAEYTELNMILSILSESTVSITYRNPEFYQIRMSFQQNRRNTVNREMCIRDSHKYVPELVTNSL